MAKKNKNKKVKPLPAPKKKHKISMSPEERERHLQEIREILDNAKKEKETQRLKASSARKISFTHDDITSILKGLKFKNPNENKKPGPLPKAASNSVNGKKTGKEAALSEVSVTTSYYDRWFRLVSRKPDAFEEGNYEEVPEKEYQSLPKGVSPTVKSTFNLYKKHLTADEIAKKRDLTVGTICLHFCQLIEMGAVSVHEVLSTIKINDITKAIKKAGSDKLADIKALCPSPITYEDIKLMLSHLKKKKKT